MDSSDPSKFEKIRKSSKLLILSGEPVGWREFVSNEELDGSNPYAESKIGAPKAKESEAVRVRERLKRCYFCDKL